MHINEENSKPGPRPYSNLSMFKALVLGQWHNLSDPGFEEALNMRLDFMIFTGFDIGDDVLDGTRCLDFAIK